MSRSPRATPQDIARLAGVPVEEVTKVILGQPNVDEYNRRKIQQAMKSLGIVSISHQGMASATTIGIVIPGAIVDDYIGTVARGASETAKRYGCSVLMNVQGPDHEDDLTALLDTGGADGIVAIVPFNYHRLIDMCHRYGRDYVLVDYEGDDDVRDVPTVEVEDREGMMMLAHHLLELGHRRIGFIGGRWEYASAQKRYQGYLDALAEAGIPHDPELVKEGDWMHPSGYEMGKQLLQLDNPPTAIMASNDLEAFGVMQAVREAGLTIGKDVSVTGFDDISLAATVSPPLTTVRQPAYQLGEVAAEMLIKRLRGEPLSQLHVRLPTELVIRQSTGPVPPGRG